MLNFELHDQLLSKSIFTEPRPSLIAYAVGLIREALTGDPPALPRNYFQYTIDFLTQLSNANKATDE